MSLGAQTFSFTIDSQPVLIDPTGPVSNMDLSMVCDVPGTPTGGLQLCFAWNPDEINLFGIQPLACNPQVGCAFFAPYFTNGVDDTTFDGPYGPGVGYVAMLFDFNPANFPTFDVASPIVRFQVYSGPLATPGPAVLSFVSGLHLPGQFTTVLEVGYTDDTGQSAGYLPPDFPGAVSLVSNPLFMRGDANEDGTLNLVDCLRVLEIAFLSGIPPVCEATLDSNGSGTFDALPDVMYLLAYLFQGGPAPGGTAACIAQDPGTLSCPVGPCP